MIERYTGLGGDVQILEPSFRAAKVLSTEDSPPSATALVLDAAVRLATGVAHSQAFGHHSGQVDQQGEIIDRHTIRTFVRRSDTFPPHRIRSTRSTVDLAATVL